MTTRVAILPVLDLKNHGGGRLRGYSGRWYEEDAPWEALGQFEAAIKDEVLAWANTLGADHVDVAPDPTPQQLAENA
jgi:hypothetical protein